MTEKVPDNCDIVYLSSNNDTCFTGVQNKEKIIFQTQAAGLVEVRALFQMTNYKDEWRVTPGKLLQIEFAFLYAVL